MADFEGTNFRGKDSNDGAEKTPKRSGGTKKPRTAAASRTTTSEVDGAEFLDTGSQSPVFMVEDKMLREQDRFLPIANISRIMKRYIPDSGKIAKDAKECMQECVSEFVSFITSEASDRCHNEKRKTINGEDILWAMQTLGFEPYVEPLKLYLSKYRAACKGDKALQDMGLGSSSDDPMDAASECSTATAVIGGGHQDISALLSSGNQILLNGENVSIITSDGQAQNQGSGGAASGQQQQQLAFLTTGPNGQQQIMYLENFQTASFPNTPTGQNTQPQFITLNRQQGVQLVQLVPQNMSGHHIIVQQAQAHE